MLCSLQNRLTVSISHRDAPSSSGPSAAGEEQRDSLILLCEAGGWLGACSTGPAPAAPGRTKCRVSGDHPATPARADTQPPPLPIQCHGGKLSLRCGATEKAEKQVLTAAVGEHGFSLPAVLWTLPAAAAHHCSRQQNSPALPPARQPRAPGGLKQNELLWRDYPSAPGRAEQASMSVLGSGLLGNRKQCRLIFNSFVQSSTKNSPKFWGLVSL